MPFKTGKDLGKTSQRFPWVVQTIKKVRNRQVLIWDKLYGIGLINWVNIGRFHINIWLVLYFLEQNAVRVTREANIHTYIMETKLQPTLVIIVVVNSLCSFHRGALSIQSVAALHKGRCFRNMTFTFTFLFLRKPFHNSISGHLTAEAAKLPINLVIQI